MFRLTKVTALKYVDKRIRDDRDSVDPLEKAGIYRVNYRREGGRAEAYIGKSKRKIKERIAEHKRDIKLNKETTALAKLNRKKIFRELYTFYKAL